jgi:DNA-binding transcriptional LysR family regulator
MLEHRQLQFFLSACEKKSFSKAAEECFISQQGLSKSIKQMEEELDVPLFHRTAQGIELTEFGHALRSAAKSYINHHDDIVQTIRQLKEKTKTRVSVGMYNGIFNMFPAEFFKTFILKHPELELNIMSFDDDNFQNSMLEHKIHIGFCSAPVDTNLFDSIYNERSKFMLIAGKEHRLAKFSSIKFKALKDETLIVLNNHIYPQPFIMDLCAQNGFKPAMLLNGAEMDLIHELCGTNQIVGLLPGPHRKQTGLVLIDIEDIDLYGEFHLIVNKHAYISEAAKQFIAYAKEQLSKR